MKDNEYTGPDLEMALDTLRNGGIILYPTDTIWGLGCDALNKKAIERIYEIKKRPDNKSMIILVAEEKDILQYVADPDPQVFDFIGQQSVPTTIIFNNAIGLPENLISSDGSVAIRLVQDIFCRHLVKRLKRPIVSTSANLSGESTPLFFQDITDDIKSRVDYIVKWRQYDKKESKPSRIIKWQQNGVYTIIRP